VISPILLDKVCQDERKQGNIYSSLCRELAEDIIFHAAVIKPGANKEIYLVDVGN